MAVYDFLTKEFAYVAFSAFYWLVYFSRERSWAEALAEHGSRDEAQLEAEVMGLVRVGFITNDTSQLREKQDAFRRQWKLDVSSALFHFTVTDNGYASLEESIAEQQNKLATSEQPELMQRNQFPNVILPSPFEGECRDVIEFFCRRRTNRTNAGYALRIEELSACLFAGMGITGFVKATSGALPLSMTPSGGARNPYEAYVIVNRGQGIEPGAYHYSALQHTLEKVGTNQAHELDVYLGNQEWAKDMSVCVVLVARLERTMWKYSDPNAYRVVLIEAGHIAQNIMLAATRLGLSACATGALAHAEISSGLGLGKLTDIPVYALTIDKPQPYADEFVPNDYLAHMKPPQGSWPGCCAN